MQSCQYNKKILLPMVGALASALYFAFPVPNSTIIKKSSEFR